MTIICYDHLTRVEGVALPFPRGGKWKGVLNKNEKTTLINALITQGPFTCILLSHWPGSHNSN